MGEDLKEMKEFFTNMKAISGEMLQLIDNQEKGIEPSEDELARILGKFMMLQMKLKSME